MERILRVVGKTADALEGLAEINTENANEAEEKDVQKLKSDIEAYLSFLNEPCEIKEGKRFYPFLAGVKKLEESIIGLKPGECQIWEYGSGKRCLFDMCLNTAEVLGVWPTLLKQQKARQAEKSEEWRQTSLIKKILCVPISIILLPVMIFFAIFLYLLMKLVLKELSKRILGQYDIADKTSFPTGRINIISPNIQRVAEKMGYNLETLEKYVVLHEEVHDTQAHNFPLNEKRKELMGKVLNGDKSAEEELEAFMMVIEGHAEFFSEKIAAEILPGFKFERTEQGAIKNKLLGFDKMQRRYTTGSRFIEALYLMGGSQLANLPLKNPPKSMEEVENPETYLAYNLQE